ncbi:hypothetical protein SLS55_001445 [Diplodia seriata]|uniref:RNase H type-1 domain-containing protein n=1 Tax=Diplodia seriata TaxID=420778 RepID=A0ABR3CPD0_9PEZI
MAAPDALPLQSFLHLWESTGARSLPPPYPDRALTPDTAAVREKELEIIDLLTPITIQQEPAEALLPPSIPPSASRPFRYTIEQKQEILDHLIQYTVALRVIRAQAQKEEQEHEQEQEQAQDDAATPPPRRPTTPDHRDPPAPPTNTPIAYDPRRAPSGTIRGTAVVRPARAAAIAFAKRFSAADDTGILAVFTDGSASPSINADSHDRFCGAAVVYRDGAAGEWVERGYAVPPHQGRSSVNAELFATGRGLRDAKAYIIKHREEAMARVDGSGGGRNDNNTTTNNSSIMMIHTLYVFSDLQTLLTESVVERIARGAWTKVDYWLLHEFLRLDAELADLGVRVEYHWVPGHAGVEGNERADRVAAAARPDRMYPDVFVVLPPLPPLSHEEQVRRCELNRERKRKMEEESGELDAEDKGKRARRRRR